MSKAVAVETAHRTRHEGPNRELEILNSDFLGRFGQTEGEYPSVRLYFLAISQNFNLASCDDIFDVFDDFTFCSPF